MAIYSGFSHWKWWFSKVMLVYQRVYYFTGIWPYATDVKTSCWTVLCGHNTFMNRLHVHYLTPMANWSSTVSVARVDRKASFVCLDFDIRGFPLWGSHIGRFFTQMGRASNAAREKTGSTLGNGKVCTQFRRYSKVLVSFRNQRSLYLRLK